MLVPDGQHAPVQDVHDIKLTSRATPSSEQSHSNGTAPMTESVLVDIFTDGDNPIQPSIAPNACLEAAPEAECRIKCPGGRPSTVKLTKHDGRKHLCKPQMKQGVLRGIVDTGATLHLLQDETTSELIDSIKSDRPTVQLYSCTAVV